MHPHFPPKFGGVHLIVQKVRYIKARSTLFDNSNRSISRNYCHYPTLSVPIYQTRGEAQSLLSMYILSSFKVISLDVRALNHASLYAVKICSSQIYVTSPNLSPPEL